MEKRKIVVTCEVGYCGMDSTEYYEVDFAMTEDEINDACWELALANAEMYGYYPSDYSYSAEEEDNEGSGDWTSDNIEGSFKDFVPCYEGEADSIKWNQL